MRHFLPLLVLVFAATGIAQEKPSFAGPSETGFLLPNGWRLTPAGKHLVTNDLPLNIIPLKDGKHVLIATSGYNRHELVLADITADAPKAISTADVRQSWFGLAMDKTESKIWWSGGGYGKLHTFALKDNKLTLTSPA